MAIANYTAKIKDVRGIKCWIDVEFEDAPNLSFKRDKIDEGLLKKIKGENVTIFTTNFPPRDYIDIKSILYQGESIYQKPIQQQKISA